MHRKIAFILTCLFIGLVSTFAQGTLITGAERTEEYLPLLKGKRVGMVINHTSILGEEQICLLDTLLQLNINVVKVFAPEHGFRGDADAGETVKDGKDSRTGTPIISLYGNNKKPTMQQMQDIDVIVFDIQDVGARFYTYISTMFYVMEACAENGKELIVLDRPNPCDYIDGPILRPAFRSFVGMLPIPILHGCTVGELARMINGEGWINKIPESCRLTVIPMIGWEHGQPYSLPIKPSPNLPNDQSIRLYASLCPFEATRISVGRGTTYPFQVLGAPDKKYGNFTFTPQSLPGFDKSPMHKERTCYGEDLRRINNVNGFTLRYFLRFYWKSGEGNSFFDRARWFDLLMGTDTVRKAILAGKSEREIRAEWKGDLLKYKDMRKKYLLY
ncbi:exo-beta-N-acetylmuramidase NamZ family protein [Bacteroides sp.]